ncbi:hypothetical protein MOBT1_002212 [Malassezia obtusa]|uniref:Uncharacterized protein n=1 Tax=Malassezia obtusa TaxID=76774 RepID=A0AAF0E190_9BASI|nr:hypothetical protein MOBT1_002212 [Malassezia obtusa]
MAAEAPAAFVPSRDLVRVRTAADLDAGLAAVRAVYGLHTHPERWVAAEDEHTAEDAAPDDPFETQCVQAWLRHAIAWACTHAPERADEGADVLVRLAGQSAAGARQCTYRFFLGAAPAAADAADAAAAAAASVCIRDIALTDDALGGRTWGAAPYLARRLMLAYAAHAPRAVLELGAGTGLTGLALHAFLHARGAAPHVVLTDHHAVVLENLAHNVASNAAHDTHVAHLDWQQIYRDTAPAHAAYTSTAQTVPASNAERARAFGTVDAHARFDVLIAADCIYDPAHAPRARAACARCAHARAAPAHA